jgi:hypothetical protein
MDAAAIERALHRLGTRFAYPIDVDFVRRYLGTLATGGTHDDEIREASALLAILEEECRGR